MAEVAEICDSSINIVVRSPKDKKDITIDGSSTTKQLKAICAREFSTPVAQLCVIYSGKILNDSDVLNSCGVRDGATVHLVIKSAHRGVEDVPERAEQIAVAGLPSEADIGATPFGLGGLGGLSGLSGLGMGSANFMDLQNRMMRETLNNPNTVRSLLDSQFVQQMLASPDMMRQLMSTNPQLQEVMERNPEILQAMSDPDLMRRMRDVVRSPAMLQELVRGQEHLIGGIRTQSTAAPASGGSASASGDSAAAAQPSGDKPQEKASDKPDETSAAKPAAKPAAPDIPQPTSVSDVFNDAGARSLLHQVAQNPQLATNMIQAPYVQTMLQSMSTNPELVQQMLMNSPLFANNPVLQQQLPQTVPYFAQQLQNPEIQNLMSNPRALQAMLLIQQGMLELHSESPSALRNSSGDSAYTQYISQMLKMASADDSGNLTDEQKFALQLYQLDAMGFCNREANIEALSATQGDVNSAINRLLEQK